MLSRARNEGEEIYIHEAEKNTQLDRFCLISYTWLFTTEAKQRILKEHVKVQQKLNFHLWQMEDLWRA